MGMRLEYTIKALLWCLFAVFIRPVASLTEGQCLQCVQRLLESEWGPLVENTRQVEIGCDKSRSCGSRQWCWVGRSMLDGERFTIEGIELRCARFDGGPFAIRAFTDSPTTGPSGINPTTPNPTNNPTPYPITLSPTMLPQETPTKSPVATPDTTASPVAEPESGTQAPSSPPSPPSMPPIGIPETTNQENQSIVDEEFMWIVASVAGGLVSALLALFLLVKLNRKRKNYRSSGEYSATAPATKLSTERYIPEPRFPSKMKTPKTVPVLPRTTETSQVQQNSTTSDWFEQTSLPSNFRSVQTTDESGYIDADEFDDLSPEF